MEGNTPPWRANRHIPVPLYILTISLARMALVDKTVLFHKTPDTHTHIFGRDTDERLCTINQLNTHVQIATTHPDGQSRAGSDINSSMLNRFDLYIHTAPALVSQSNISQSCCLPTKGPSCGSHQKNKAK